MAEFLTQLYTRKLLSNGGRGTWEIMLPLSLDDLPFTQIWTVPTGYITDYASVPRWPFAYWLAGDSGHASATIHDFLCDDKSVPRKIANDVFARALKAEGVPAWRRIIMVAAVRLYGEIIKPRISST